MIYWFCQIYEKILYVMTANIKTIWSIAIFTLLASIKDTVLIIRMKKQELNRRVQFSLE